MKQNIIIIVGVGVFALTGLIGCSDSSVDRDAAVVIEQPDALDTETVVEVPTLTPVHLVGFEHRGGNGAYLTLENGIGPATITDRRSGDVQMADYDGTGYEIPFFNQAGDNDGVLDTQTFEVRFSSVDGEAHLITLVRQSPDELSEVGIDKADGYTIMARTSLDFSDADGVARIKMDSDYAANVRLPIAQTSLSETELQLAANAADWINRQALRYGGPASLQADTLGEQMEALKAGSTGLGSATFRKLWLHLVHAAGADVRAIDLASYGPNFDDLTPYTYGMAEIKVGDDWVAIDPIGNAVFSSEGSFLSASDLRDQLRLNPDAVQSLPLVDNQTRRIRGGNDTVIAPIAPSAIGQYAVVVRTLDIDWESAETE